MSCIIILCKGEYKALRVIIQISSNLLQNIAIDIILLIYRIKLCTYAYMFVDKRCNNVN